jgi:multidrug resistance protein MdtO
VARTVIASTLIMIIGMTFRMPYGAFAAIFALIISRESLEGTKSAVRTLLIGFVLAGAYVIVGEMLVIADPLLRFLWVVMSLFLVFWAISALSNYAAAARFGYLIVITISLWDQHVPAGVKVESTLWAIGAITMASVITLLLEVAFAALRRGNDIFDPIAERLERVEELLVCYANGRPVDSTTQSAVTHLASVGTSRLRQTLQRSHYEPQYAQQMGAVVALTGRLVDIAANLVQFTSRVPDADRERLGKLAGRIGQIRDDLRKGSVPRFSEPRNEGEASNLPLLREIEETVSLIPEAFSSSRSLSIIAALPSDNRERIMAFTAGAVFSSEHIKFGLRGCVAASLCYITYNALFWPEISTAVTTCLLTALTTIGASRQKQILRFAGALVGGLVIGMGAQVFILPYIDSIGAFTVLFALVIGAAAWFATSSPRLSYFGVQVAVAFCLINLQEFKIQTSLAVARDRVVGILLGLFAMWLFFDQLWSAPAGVEMKRAFISNLRLLAQLAREPVSKETGVAIERSYALRETINAQFDKVRSLADGVLFEFGQSRQRDLALRDRIRTWQPRLRTLFVMRIASLKYALQLPGFDLPEAVRQIHREYDDWSAATLEDMADRIEGTRPPFGPRSQHSTDLLERMSAACGAGEFQGIPETHVQSFLTLVRGIDGLTSSLAQEIAAV